MKKHVRALVLLAIIQFARPSAVLGESKNTEVAEQTEQMKAAYEAGSLVEAKSIGLRIISKAPLNMTAHYLLGNVYTRLGQTGEARREYSYCCRSQTGTNVQIYQLARKGLEQLDNSSVAKSVLPASDAVPRDDKLAASKQVTERIQRFRDEGSQAVLTSQRRLESQIKAAEQEADLAASNVPQFLMPGLRNPDYQQTVQNIMESKNSKIKALRDSFEVEKKTLMDRAEKQAMDFEASQRARTTSGR
ncbi:MAG: hypothetical protein JST01_18040 [Cyanobacteria bacterium SZAS TMP-1]|nr:hypothetical protein [Cyanobacteria bacterium SZAS TMP-1]